MKRIPAIAEAALSGVLAYAVCRLAPHMVIAVTSWPVVTDNHSAALGFGFGVFAALWGALRQRESAAAKDEP